MMHAFRTTWKGFTLIEVLISLTIFTIMMVAVSQTFAAAFSGYRSTRAIERDLENAQYFMSILAKELRTSTVVSPTDGPFPNTSSSVQFYDHSQSKCIHYKIRATEKDMQMAQASITGATTDAQAVATCAALSLSSFATISTGIISGVFSVTPSTVAPTSPMRVGKMTISLDVSEAGTHHVYIQTSVSLRDFGSIGL